MTLLGAHAFGGTKRIEEIFKIMEKKVIYVTVAEFLENGGELEANRDIYYNKSGTLNDYYLGGWYVEPHTFDDMVIVGSHRGTHPMYNNIIFVQINCTPIYK